MRHGHIFGLGVTRRSACGPPVRHLQAARELPNDEDIVARVYGSEDFKEGCAPSRSAHPVGAESSLAADVAVARQLDAVAHRVARRGRVDVLHAAVFHLDAQAAHARTARGG